jgi:hypothetical protein
MPIVVGSPRSGTTLLRFMLDAHPEMAIPPETSFLTLGWNATTRIIERLGRGHGLRKRFFRTITSFPTWPDFEISHAAFWDALKDIDPFTVADGYRAFYRLYAARFGKPRWGDKTPLYGIAMDAIRHVLPEARFIHVIRDGRDASLSLRQMWFTPGWDIETQAAYWRHCVLAARRTGVGHPDYIEVRYEDVILHTPDVLKRLCAFVDLAYDDAMLRYYTRTPARLEEHKARLLPDGTLLTHAQRLRQQERTMEPPDRTRIFAWKAVMSTDERERFRRVAGDLLTELGYEA